MPVMLIIIQLMMILYNLSMYECIYGDGYDELDDGGWDWGQFVEIGY